MGAPFGSSRGEERVLPASSRRSRSRLTRRSRATNVGLTRATIRGVEFELLGPLRVVEGGRDVTPARPKQRALLAMLLLHREEVVPGAAADRGAVGRGAAGNRADRAARARLRAAQADRRRSDQDAPARLSAAGLGRTRSTWPGSSRWSRRRESATIRTSGRPACARRSRSGAGSRWPSCDARRSRSARSPGWRSSVSRRSRSASTPTWRSVAITSWCRSSSRSSPSTRFASACAAS